MTGLTVSDYFKLTRIKTILALPTCKILLKKKNPNKSQQTKFFKLKTLEQDKCIHEIKHTHTNLYIISAQMDVLRGIKCK